jgi:ribosomal protein L9
MEVILLERIEKLGTIGDVVRVKNGYARNFLLPRGKALRANDANRKVFEQNREKIEAQNEERRSAAETDAKKIDGLKIQLIRQASNTGQLYGSVSARDLAEALEAATDGGADVVIDPLWGEPALAALGILRPYGRLVQLGESAAAAAEVASATVRGRPLSILGHTNFAVPLGVRREAYGRMVAHAVAGELTATYETVPLERAPEAWERQRAGPGTKLVVVP